MTARRFHKMHGLGNDFVIFDGRDDPLDLDGAAVRALSDRHTGIGCDQLAVIGPSDVADLSLRIWNGDGNEVESCGNLTRCVGALEGRALRIETAGGIVSASPAEGGITVDMGVPRFEWDAIPLAYPLDTGRLPVAWSELAEPVAVNVGNPHVVFFVDDVAAIDLAVLGPRIEHDPLFPERINVNVAEAGVAGLNLRVWERGAGLTRACGTGACASAVAAIRRRLAASPVRVSLPGGDLVIAWEDGGSVRMTGAASHVFSGEIALPPPARVRP